MKKVILFVVLGVALTSGTLPVLAGEPLPATRAQVGSENDFPSIKRATRPQGVFVPAKHVAMVAPGLKKSEVYTLLDVPHFKEGLFGVRKWNYILNFYNGKGDEFRQCQYQIRYDNKARVESTWWKGEACAALVEQALAEPKTVERVVTEYVNRPVPVAEERAVRTYSFNFDFNRSNINAEGRRVIGLAVKDALAASYRRIVVSGFTDTVGSTEYNDALAARRAAATVAELSSGLKAAGSPLADQTFSRGGRDLAVPTRDEVRDERNRRVVIEFY